MSKTRTVACLACRQRKSQCRVDKGQSPTCMACRSHQTDCAFPPPRAKRQRQKPAKKRWIPTIEGGRRDSCADPDQRTNLHDVGERADLLLAPHSQNQLDGTAAVSLESPAEDTSNPRQLGPIMSSDGHHVSQLVDNFQGNGRIIAKTFRSGVGTGWHAPIQFTHARRRPAGLGDNFNPAKEKLKIIEKLTEPWQAELIQLYMSKSECCFPMLSNDLKQRLLNGSKDTLSPALLACLYANALAFWSSSPALAPYRRPDQRFIWNLANESLFTELRLAPSLQSLAAVLLNISGRPTSMVFNNAGQLGFAISVAYTLGLNRDPASWSISEDEKSLRKNLWCGLAIYDKWQSLAFGIPPLLQSNQADVSLPKINVSDRAFPNETGKSALEIYVNLLSLSEDVLAPLLDELYQVSGCTRDEELDQGDFPKLQQWIDSITGLSRKIILRGNDLSAPGSADLRLAFLIVQFLEARVGLQSQIGADAIEKLQSTMRAAEDVVFCLQELQPSHLQDFWMPTMGHCLLMVMTFLLRSTLKYQNTANLENGPLGLASKMMECLRRYRKEVDWDIADLCLEYYDQALAKLAGAGEMDNPAPIDLNLDPENLDMPFIWDDWIVGVRLTNDFEANLANV